MSSLGSLVVSLAANTAQFSSDMGKAAHDAEKRMDAIRKSAEKAGKAIGAAFVAGVGVASVLVKQSIDAADEMTKMAQKAGVSTEAFSTLAYAANLSGVEMGSLQSSMSKLAATMTDVVRGTNKDAVDAFRTLGIAVQDSSGKLKSGDVIMSEVAARFATMENGVGKTALAIKIFGRSGADLVPLLNSGADGIKAMQDEARALGVELDGNAGAAAERFNDNLTRLNTVKQGFANQIMKAVLPSLNSMTDALVESAKASSTFSASGKAIKTILDTIIVLGANVAYVFKGIGTEIGGIAAQIAALATGDFKGFAAIGAAMKEDAAKARKEIDEFSERILKVLPAQIESAAPAIAKKIAAPMMMAAEKTAKARKEFESEAHKIWKANEKTIDSLALQADTMGKSSKEVELWKLMLAKATDAQMQMAEVILDGIDAKQKDIDLQEYAKRVYEDSRTPLEKYTAEVQKLNDAREKGAITNETYARAVIKAQEDMVKATKDPMEDMKRSIEGWGKQFTDTFVDGVMKGKLSFKDLANSIIADILRIATQKMITDKIIGSWGTGAGGSGGAGFLGIVSAFMGGGKALGGDVKGGASYLVGERGPEIFTPATSGAIIPNGSMGASISPTYNINIDSRTDRAQVMQDVQRATKQANAELVDKLQRMGRL
jgi:outer membrane murein-binding lipoprotein Lpp